VASNHPGNGAIDERYLVDTLSRLARVPHRRAARVQHAHGARRSEARPLSAASPRWCRTCAARSPS